MDEETKELIKIALEHVERTKTPVEIGNVLIEYDIHRIKITN